MVTRGIDVNALVGRRFRIGEVECAGRRLCEPCSHLQRLTRPGILRALVHRGGLRADVIGGGEIRVGDAVVAIDRGVSSVAFIAPAELRLGREAAVPRTPAAGSSVELVSVRLTKSTLGPVSGDCSSAGPSRHAVKRTVRPSRSGAQQNGPASAAASGGSGREPHHPPWLRRRRGRAR